MNVFTMIDIKRIVPQTVELFAPNEQSLGFINEYEFYDIRVQIRENQLEGYYLLFNNEKIVIDKNGKYNGKKGLFDMIVNYSVKLF
jgi:hypothetical protein